MRTHRRIPPYLIGAALLLALMLSACGAASTSSPSQAPAAPVESPEERVKGFFATFSSAISDPEIGDEARQAEWVDRLVDYAAPAEQAQARTELAASLAEFTGMDLGEMTGQPGLDVRLEMNFVITETRLVEESGDTARVEVLDGLLSMRPVGADVEQLGEMADMMTQEVPIGEFFNDAGNDDRIIDLVRVDGVWYIVDTLSMGV